MPAPGEGPAPASAPPTPAKAQLPRAPPEANHRRSHSLSHRPTMLKFGSMFGHREEIPATAGPELSTFSEKMEEEQQPTEMGEKPVSDQQQGQDPSQPEHDMHPFSAPVGAGATLVRKFGTLLGANRAGDDGTRRSKRTSILGSLSPRPSRDENAAEGAAKGSEEKDNDAYATISSSQSQPAGTVHRRAATVLDPAGRAARHERRSSTGASLFASAGGTIGRHRRPSTSAGPAPGSAPAKGIGFGRTDEEDEHDADGMPSDQAPKSDDEQDRADKEFKPVFLKGMFRYGNIVLCDELLLIEVD